MVQASNRVGRGGDKCRRVILGDIELVDHLASCTYKKRLVQFIEAMQAKKELKPKQGFKDQV